MGNDSAEDIFGRRVRDERKMRGWTQAQLAEKLSKRGLSLHPSAIAKIEDRDVEKPRTIRLDEATALAKVFGLQLDEMYENERQRIGSLMTRIVMWAHRLQEELRENGVSLLMDVEDLGGEAEGFLRADYLREIIDSVTHVEALLSVYRHPSRSQWLAEYWNELDEADDSEA